MPHEVRRAVFWTRRLYLFARDYCQEFGCAWAIARSNDCERNGGHPWEMDTTPRAAIVFGDSHVLTCRRCGCSQSVPSTAGTAGSGLTYTVGNSSN